MQEIKPHFTIFNNLFTNNRENYCTRKQKCTDKQYRGAKPEYTSLAFSVFFADIAVFKARHKLTGGLFKLCGGKPTIFRGYIKNYFFKHPASGIVNLNNGFIYTLNRISQLPFEFWASLKALLQFIHRFSLPV